MSAELREAYGVLSNPAVSVVRALRSPDSVELAGPDLFVQQVEARAIFAFVSEMSALYQKHTGEAMREDMIVACARFGVNPDWFYMDQDSGEMQDALAARALRADVAHYRIMHALDEEDE